MEKKSPPPAGSGSAATIDEVARQVEAWVSSTDGTKQLLATKESARIAAEKVTSDAQVDAEQLRQAVTL
jgi:hypothetical protein